MTKRTISILLDEQHFKEKPSRLKMFIDSKGNYRERKTLDKKTNKWIDLKDKEGNTVYHSEESIVQSRIPKQSVTVSLEELKNSILNGQTYTVSEFKESSKGWYRRVTANWKSSSIIGIDMDNGMTPEIFLGMCNAKRIKPFLMYTTFSDSPSLRKFRALFLLKEKCTNLDEYIQAVYILNNLFEGNTDTHCTDPARMFYGGKELIAYTPEHTVDIKMLISSNINLAHKPKIVKGATKSSLKSALKPVNKPVKPYTKVSFTPPHILKLNNIKKINICGVENEVFKSLESLDITTFKDYLDSDLVAPFKNKSFKGYNQIIQHIKEIPLTKLFNKELDISFNCVFHHDKNPSAFISKRNGIEYYVCNSSNCNMDNSHDILSVVGYLLTGNVGTKSFRLVLDFFMRELNLKVELDEESKRNYLYTLDTITNNIMQINGMFRYEKEYPLLYKKMMYSQNVAMSLMAKGLEVLTYQNSVMNTESLIISISQSEIAKRIGASTAYQKTTGVYNRINDLIFIGLIEQLTDAEVLNLNKKVYDSAQRLRGDCEGRKTINTYRINRINEDMYEKIEKNIKNAPTRKATRKDTLAIRDIKASQKSDNIIDMNSDYFIAMEKWYINTMKKKKIICEEAFEDIALKYNVPFGPKGNISKSILDILCVKYKMTKKIRVSKLIISEYSLKKTLTPKRNAFIKSR